MISKTFIERPKFAMVIALIITLSGLISMPLRDRVGSLKQVVEFMQSL